MRLQIGATQQNKTQFHDHKHFFLPLKLNALCAHTEFIQKLIYVVKA